jgi:hypothetical protein
VTYVSNAELANLSISSWLRVILAFVLLFGFGFLITIGGWIAFPLFFACAAFCCWSLAATAFYVISERGAAGVFRKPMTARALFFARFIIKEAIRN